MFFRGAVEIFAISFALGVHCEPVFVAVTLVARLVSSSGCIWFVPSGLFLLAIELILPACVDQARTFFPGANEIFTISFALGKHREPGLACLCSMRIPLVSLICFSWLVRCIILFATVLSLF